MDGVVEHGPEIDLLLEEHAEGWTVSRMTALDRTIMRVAVEELLRGDVPPSVAISEAVEAASELSAEESRSFVNGVLGRIARELARRTCGPREVPGPGRRLASAAWADRRGRPASVPGRPPGRLLLPRPPSGPS